MRKDLAINIMSAILLLLGFAHFLPAIFLAQTRTDILPSTIQAILLVVAGWLLFKRQNLSVFILAISATDYFGSIAYAAYTNNILLSMLSPAFYWSLTLRVLIVFFVFYLLKRANYNDQC